MTAPDLKLPPQSLEAEQSVLGGLMLDHSRWDQIVGRVTEEDFYRREHRLIFQALAALCDTGVPLDVVTVSEWLAKNGELSAAGGLSYLGQIANNTPSAANIVAYANIVHDHGALRRLISAASDITRAAFNPEGRSVAELLDYAEKHILDISEQAGRKAREITFDAAAASALKNIERRADGEIKPLSTGLVDLDTALGGGLEGGQLVVVAGRPSMGKTSLAEQFVERAGGAGRVLFVSLEMRSDAIAERAIARRTGIPMPHLRQAQKLTPDQWSAIAEAAGAISRWGIVCNETARTAGAVIRSARAAAKNGGITTIVIDYLQLMSGGDEASDNRATEISTITRTLKSLALELNVPVVLLSQLNRNLEQRPNRRPIMSDLRESGAIEQDADVILFIYRDEIYNDDSPDKGTAEIIIGKQRNGPTGKVRVAWLGERMTFADLAREWHPANQSDKAAALVKGAKENGAAKTERMQRAARARSTNTAGEWNHGPL